MRAPSPLVFSPHSILPRNNLLLSHLSLSLPRGALGFGDGDRRNLDPRGELPSPPFSSLSLFLFLPFPSLRTPPSSPLRACPPAAPHVWPLAPARAAVLAPSRAAVLAPAARPLAPGAASRPLAARPSRPTAARPSTRPPAPSAWLPDPLAHGTQRAAVPAPVHGLCLRQRGPPACPPFTQHVPACAAPRAR
jgi:hypothetical protein